MRLGLLLVIGAAACGDDLSVTVDVTHPGPVARTVISVYESPSVDCTKIEFGDLDADALDSTLVAEEVHGGSGELVSGDLDGISRTDDKAIVARGYDDLDGLVSAGCVMKGVVEGKDRVPLETVPAMIVSVVSRNLDPYTITVLAAKPDGGFLNKREVSWHVYAPTGTAPIAPQLATTIGTSEWQPPRGSCTNASGVARIHPVPPSLIGGFATRIRASWAANVLPLETALSRADISTVFPLRPPPTTKHVCAIKIAGSTRRLVCLDTQPVSGNTIARELTATIGAGRVTLTSSGVQLLATPPLGVFSKPAATSGDLDVFVVDTGGQQIPVFTTAAAQPTSCGGCTVSDFLFAPSCGPMDPARLVLQTGAASIGVVPSQGGTLVPLPMFADVTISNLALQNAGCVNLQSPQSTKIDRQVVVADVTQSDGTVVTRGFYNCDMTGCNKLVLPVPEAGVGFATSPTGERRLVGASIDATGLVMSSWVIRATLDTTSRVDILLERDRVPAAQLPQDLVAGKLDDDAGYDLVWNLQGTRGTTLQLAYSRMAGDQRLEALAPFPGASKTGQLLLDDLSNDMHPELVLVAELGAGPSGTTPVFVIPTHVPPDSTMTAAEDCR
ncbi:MAG: hypothetical protein JNL83_28645 [Myxococcales bacterium]|nr:hypothetical protein [Myxococcales bacterium]